jgi:uncharacterized membrane protein HdeD (DUF308 family)
MKMNLKKNWWVLLINGLIAVLFGALAVFATNEMLESIQIYFGLLIVIGGLMLLFGAYDKYKKDRSFSIMLTEGIVSVLLGALIMLFPEQSLRIFLIFIGIWAVLLGLFKIFIAISIRDMDSFKYVLIIGGILLFGIGLLLLLDPTYVAGAVLKIIGAVFVVLGMILIYYSFMVRSLK